MDAAVKFFDWVVRIRSTSFESAVSQHNHCGARYRCATKLAMLYQRWQRIAREHAGLLALADPGTNRQWTFAELDEAAGRRAGGPAGLRFRQGAGADFILDVLRAWQDGALVCPLESGQADPSAPNPPKQVAHLKTTSATTGTARLVAFTAVQLAADADNIVQTMGLRPDWPNLGVISLAHSYGFSNLVLPLLLHGIPLVLVDSPLPESLRRAAATVPQATLPAVPALWRTWHEAGAIPANVRLAISAGAPLPLALEQDVFANAGLKIHNFYGATECGGIAYDDSTTPRTDAACVGAPMRNVTLSVNNDGCLEVRGAAVGQTYWPGPEPSLGGGCYVTSDLVEIEDGRVFLRGRAGDQINVAGRKLSPETVECALSQHPQVRDCLVFGAPKAGNGRGETIVACVVASPGVDAETLRQFLIEQLPAWQVPREWRLLDSLSPNQRGKLSRAEWRARLGFV
jgi:acyl-coenzyme A synthetase/AMP-(fatty) acid ligase